MGHLVNSRMFLLLLACLNVGGSTLPEIPSASSFLPGKYSENQDVTSQIPQFDIPSAASFVVPGKNQEAPSQLQQLEIPSASSFVPGKYNENNQDAPSPLQIQQFEIPAHLVPSGLMSMSAPSTSGGYLSQPPQPPPSLSSAASNASAISLLSQGTTFGEGMSSNWDISDVSIEGADATLDEVNVGFSSLSQWANTLQETEFVLQEAIGLENLIAQEIQMESLLEQEAQVDAASGLETLLEQVVEEEEEVAELQEEVIEIEEHPKNVSGQTILQVPSLAPLVIQMPPVELPSISIQNGYFSEAEVEEAPKNNTNPTNLDLPLLTPLDINLPPIEVSPIPFQAAAVPEPEEVEVVAIAPSPSTPVLVEYTPLSEYGWHGNLGNIANSVGGSQNTGGSQIMSMNLSGNLMDVNATQNVNVHVSSHGLGGSSSAQVLGDGIGWGKPNNKKPELATVPKRVTVQLRAPPPGKALIYQFISNPKYI